MDSETQIAERLASTSPKPMAYPQGYPSIEEVGDKSPQAETGLEPQDAENPFEKLYNKQQLNEYFGVNPQFRDASSEYIDSVMSFAEREVGSSNIADIILYIRGVEQALGSKLSGNRLGKINQFITLRNQHRLLEQKQKAMIE